MTDSATFVTTATGVLSHVTALHRCIAASRWQNRSPVSVIALVPLLPASAEVGDPAATRTVYITVVALIVLGIGLGVLALWLVRRTRPEPQLLAPLEEMETRAWRKQDPAGQRRALDASRPAGARPVRREAAEPAVDTDFAAARPVVGFDDLVDGEQPDDAASAAVTDSADDPAVAPGDVAADGSSEVGDATDHSDAVAAVGPDGVEVAQPEGVADTTADLDVSTGMEGLAEADVADRDDVEVPDVEVADVEVPDVEVPDAAVPDAAVPDAAAAGDDAAEVGSDHVDTAPVRTVDMATADGIDETDASNDHEAASTGRRLLRRVRRT